MKQVDIIIPVHNRPEHTKQTLESLLNHTPRELYELYVVDDGSNMETFNVIMDVSKRFTNSENPKPFTFFQHAVAIGPGASRNEVCNEITKGNNRSEYLYHSDSDVYFTENWLERLISTYEFAEKCNFKVKLLGGGCHKYLQSSSRLPVALGNIGIKDAVSGYSQLMTWETWDQFGNFSDTNKYADKKIAGSEDWLYCQNIIKAGFKVGSMEPEVVYHCGRTNTYGELATGHETIQNIDGVMVK